MQTSPKSKSFPPSMKRELSFHLHLPPSNPQIDSNPNPNPSSVAAIETPEPDAGVPIAGADEDEALRRAATLSREEVLRRRSRRLRQLIGVYRQQFWALTEGVRAKHRSYYWDYGMSPVVEEDDGSSAARSESRAADHPPSAPDEWTGDSGRPGVLGLGLGFDGEKENGGCGSRERPSCAYGGCKAYAMPLTTFCHPHILMDQKQTLYKACGYAIKRYCSHEWLDGAPNCLAPHQDVEIAKERRACIQKFFPNFEVRRAVNIEFRKLLSSVDEFQDVDSLRDRGIMDPKLWWVVHGVIVPKFQGLALKLLGQLCSSSCCERN